MNAEAQKFVKLAYAESFHAHDLIKVISAKDELDPTEAGKFLEHCRKLNCAANQLRNASLGLAVPKLEP